MSGPTRSTALGTLALCCVLLSLLVVPAVSAGTAGMAGTPGTPGMAGTPGTPGTPGMAGTPGSHGIAGTASVDSGQAAVTVATEMADGTLSVDVRITNEGEITGRYTIELVSESRGLVAERDLRVPPEGTRQAVFDTEVTGTESYTVYVNGVEVETFSVTGSEEANTTADRRTPGPIVVSVLGGILFLITGIILFRLT